MRKKPFSILFVTLGLILVPVIIAVRIYLLRNDYAFSFTFQTLRPLIIFSSASLIIAYGVWKVRLWGFYSLIFFSFISLVTDLHSIYKGSADFGLWALLDIFSILAGIGLIIQKNVRSPYLDPKIRWWEQAARYQVDIDGFFTVNDYPTAKAHILDISATGCFADFEFDHPVGTQLVVEIQFKDLLFKTDAKFVRRSQNPKGIGIMFVDTTNENKKIMKDLLKKITIKQKR